MPDMHPPGAALYWNLKGQFCSEWKEKNDQNRNESFWPSYIALDCELACLVLIYMLTAQGDSEGFFCEVVNHL